MPKTSTEKPTTQARASPKPSNKQLNVGVLCRADGVAKYQSLALRELSGVPNVRLSFCFHLAVRGLSREPLTPARSLRRRFVRFLFPKTELERRVPLEESLHGLPRIPLAARREGAYSTYLEDQSLGLLKSLQLDIIVNCNTHILRGPMLTAPRFGIWSYHHGEPQEYRGYPPGFWEIYHGAPQTGAVLQKLEEALDDGVILRKTSFPTIHHSYWKQRERLFAAGVSWPADVAKQLLKDGELNLTRTTPPTQAPIYTRPNNRQLLKFCFVLLKNKLRRAVCRRHL